MRWSHHPAEQAHGQASCPLPPQSVRASARTPHTWNMQCCSDVGGNGDSAGDHEDLRASAALNWAICFLFSSGQPPSTKERGPSSLIRSGLWVREEIFQCEDHSHSEDFHDLKYGIVQQHHQRHHHHQQQKTLLTWWECRSWGRAGAPSVRASSALTHAPKSPCLHNLAFLLKLPMFFLYCVIFKLSRDTHNCWS